jgi:competence ComEA-like helix-hairpin-helix protein
MGHIHSCWPLPIEKRHRVRRHRSCPLQVKHDLCQHRPIQDMNKHNHTNNNNNPINLNRASEDELVMLPGVTRSIAQGIVDYRQVNHNFKQIDELRHIDGIDNDVFERIRFNIVIDSLSNHVNQPNLINLNRATYEELGTIPGLTPLLIERILQYRQRQGSLRFVEDLLKIKDIDYIVLARLRRYVTVDERSMPLSVSQSSMDSPSAPNQLCPTLNPSIANVTVDSLSLTSLLFDTLPPELQHILRSSLPQQCSSLSITNETTVRFASWNLQQLTNDKVQNPGVREVICRIILTHK